MKKVLMVLGAMVIALFLFSSSSNNQRQEINVMSNIGIEIADADYRCNMYGRTCPSEYGGMNGGACGYTIQWTHCTTTDPYPYYYACPQCGYAWMKRTVYKCPSTIGPCPDY